MVRRAGNLKPKPKRTVSEWCGENVNLVQGLTPRLDVNIAPHMKVPLNMVSKHGIKEMHWLWSPGGGKTTGIEGSIQWKMANAPSNILVVGQKDDTAERWMETRLTPSIQKNPALRDLMPSSKGNDRHRMKKTTIIFNHGFYLEAGGSAESNLQEKSMPTVIMDEAWKLSEHPGRIQQAKQRTHDKWNAMILFAGQAGDTHYDPDNDDAFADLYREWKKVDQRTFCWKCKECDTIQPFKWDHMKWDKVEIEGYGIDWQQTGKTVRMECCDAECTAAYPDDVKNRRMLAESLMDSEWGGYEVSLNKHPLEGTIGFHANSMCYWRVPWVKLVQQFEEAMESKFRGDTSLLRIFVTQRLAEFWAPVHYEMKHDLEMGGYKISDFDEGQLIDGEELRGIGVDVQQNDLWFTISAFSEGGKMQILQCGQALGFDDIEKLREQYKIPRPRVVVDSKYRRDYVFQQCSKYGWTAYRGVFKEDYLVRSGGEMIRAPYSEVVPVQSGGGGRTQAINFCVNPIKDVIAEMRAGRMGSLLVPDDIDPRFKEHLNAEVKRKVVAGRERREQEMWVRVGKRDNHMLDNVMALVGMGMVKGLIQTNTERAEVVE